MDIENLPGEEWKDIPGYDGVYLISNMGRVLSKKRKVHALLKMNMINTGYPQLQLRKDGGRKLFLLHRMVMMTFEPIQNPERFEVNHKNFDTTDARLSNLEWCTPKENAAHYFANTAPSEQVGFGKSHIISGASHHLSKLTDADVMEIRRLCATRARGIQRRAAKQFEISLGTVRQIITRQTWRHLP